MKNLLFVALAINMLITLPQLAVSQSNPIDINAFGYYNEAIRFSQTHFGGTARFQSIGGASAALGGDISSAYVNPAGLGFNQKSEFSFTPGLTFNNATGNYLGEATDGSRFGINLSQLGFVFANPKNSLGPDKGGSFAINVQRINDFQGSAVYEGVNADHQIVDFFLEQGQGVPWDELDQQGIDGTLTTLGMAYFTYLINPDFLDDPGTNDTYRPIDVFTFPTRQREEIVTRGNQYEWSLSYGGNFDDIFYYGVGLGIQTLRYERDREYTETVSDAASNLDNLIFIDRLSQSGVGANLKAGVLLRLTDLVRVGVSFISPTWMRLQESYQEELFIAWRNAEVIEGFDNEGNPRFRNVNEENAQAIYEDITYTLQTPWRANFGVSIFAGKRGFISADVEYVDYGSAQLNNPRFQIDGVDAGFDFDADNRTIGNLYEGVLNFRIGGEMRIEYLRLRGGFAHYGDPTADESVIASGSQFFSGGVGVRKKNMFADFAVTARIFEQDRNPYTLLGAESPTANIEFNKISALLSFGVFF